METVKRQVFHSNYHRELVKRFIETHSEVTIEQLKDCFHQDGLKVPFEVHGDEVLHRWIQGIDGVKCRIFNKIMKYYTSEGLKQKRMESKQNKRLQKKPRRFIAESTPRAQERNTMIESPEDDENRFEIISRRRSNNLETTEKRQNQIVPAAFSAVRTYTPHMYGAVLIGDENFLNMAIFEMQFKIDKSFRIRQSGHCVSGLKMKQATQRVLSLNVAEVKDVIVNVGSVDIAEGKQLIEIIHDFTELLAACDFKGINIIVTTLAPLPNYFVGNKLDILNTLNHYIRTTVSNERAVIDLNKCMVNKDGTHNPHFYIPEPRYVSGSRRAFVLWNKIGRNRVHSMIMKHLAQAMIYKESYLGDFY